MWIQRVEIINFQRHAKFEADFTSKVNCIVGETDRGKSCLVRAIKWVLFNEPKGDIVRKSGTSVTKVALVLDNGIIVTKIKSDSENAYIIRRGEQEVRYDSFGKDIPDEVSKVLSAVPMEVDKENIILNMSGQLDPPFLLNASGGFRMKVLNKLIGSDILDLVVQDLNKDILRIGRDEKNVAETLTKGRAELSSIEAEYLIRKKKVDQCRAVYEGIIKSYQQYQAVSQVLSDMMSVQEEIDEVSEAVKAVGIPEGIEEMQVKAVQFDKVSQVVTSIKVTIETIEKTALQVEDVAIPENVEEYKGLAGALQSAQNLHQKAVAMTLEAQTTQSIIGQIEGEITQLRGRYKALLKEYGKCPICSSPATEGLLEGIEI